MKTALVTGANAGIGKSLVLELVQRGYKVYATDIITSEETANDFNSEFIKFHKLDVTDNEDIARIKSIIVAETDNRLDLLYCNAGIVINSHATDITDDELLKIYNVNLFGCIRLVREFIKPIVNTQGIIAFSGSVTKTLPLHSNALYSSTKAALHQYAYVLHSELKNYNVKVFDILGGAIKTNIFPSSSIEIPEDSIYNFDEYKEKYSKRSQVVNEFQKDGMETDEFAKRVLNQLEKADINTFSIYEGNKATITHMIGTWLSSNLLIKKYLDMFNLNFNYRNHLKDDQIE